MNIQQYIEEMDTVYEGQPWYGKSVKTILNRLEGADLSKSYSGGNNIAQIIEHMITWRNWGIQMFSENYAFRIQADSNADWEREKQYKSSDLEDLLTRLDKSQEKLKELLHSKDEKWLDQMIPERKFSFRQVVMGIIQHDIYHLGQIALMIK